MDANQLIGDMICSTLPILVSFGFVAWGIWRSFGRILKMEEITDQEKTALGQQSTAWMICLLLALLFLFPLPLPDSISSVWDQIRGFLPLACFAIVGYAGYNTIKHQVAGFGSYGQSVVTGQSARISGVILIVVDAISAIAYIVYLLRA